MHRLAAILLLLVATASADYGLMNRLPFDAAMREPDFEWLEADPSLYGRLFDLYASATGLPYVYLIADHWLAYNPLYRIETHVGGRVGYVWTRGLDGGPTKLTPLEIGNLNGDDVVNLADLAIYARWRGGSSGVVEK